MFHTNARHQQRPETPSPAPAQANSIMHKHAQHRAGSITKALEHRKAQGQLSTAIRKPDGICQRLANTKWQRSLWQLRNTPTPYCHAEGVRADLRVAKPRIKVQRAFDSPFINLPSMTGSVGERRLASFHHWETQIC